MHFLRSLCFSSIHGDNPRNARTSSISQREPFRFGLSRLGIVTKSFRRVNEKKERDREEKKMQGGVKKGKRVARRFDSTSNRKRKSFTAAAGKLLATLSRNRYCRSSCTINDLAIAASFLRSRDNCVDCGSIMIQTSPAACSPAILYSIRPKLVLRNSNSIPLIYIAVE